MRVLVAGLLMPLMLNGCFFIWWRSPPPAVAAPAYGNTCISAGFFTGDRIRNLETGKIGTIIQVYGADPGRCRDARHPNWADVDYK